MCIYSVAFDVGDSQSAMTKGIWIFCQPHPTQKSQVLVLLDTEGLDDAMKVREHLEKKAAFFIGKFKDIEFTKI